MAVSAFTGSGCIFNNSHILCLWEKSPSGNKCMSPPGRLASLSKYTFLEMSEATAFVG